MKNNLAAALFNVKKEFVAGFRYPHFLGHVSCGCDNFRYDLAVIRRQIVNAADMFPGNNQ